MSVVPTHGHRLRHFQMQTSSGEVTYLEEGKQKAHSKIGQPVYGAGDHEGSWAVRLLKQLSGQDEGDST